MSERLHNHQESHEHELGDAEQNYEIAPSQKEVVAPKHETKHHVKHETKVAEVEHKKDEAEKTESKSSSELKRHFAIQAQDEEAPLPPPRKQLKDTTLTTNLTIVRSGLSKTEQPFSKFVHKPLVNALSEVTGKTLLRPSAILSGGFFTLIGSSYYLYAAKQTGYKYNFLVAILLFAGGFAIGLLLEIVYKVFLRRAQS